MEHGRRDNWPSYLSVRCAMGQDDCKEWACQCRCHAPEEEVSSGSKQGTSGTVGPGSGV